MPPWTPEQLSAFASLVTAAIAAFALGAAVLQIHFSTKAARAASAAESHRQYIQLCIDNPDFSGSAVALKTLGRTGWKGILAEADDPESADPRIEKYLWMLSFVLNNSEQILTHEPNSPQWRKCLIDQLGYHLSALEEVWPAWKDHYGDDVKLLVSQALAKPSMKHFCLFYEYPADFRERRAPFRGAHLEYASASVSRDELQLGGAFTDDPPQGMLLFKGETAAVAENFAKTDPYVLNGVVQSWRVREWTTVVGPGALAKV